MDQRLGSSSEDILDVPVPGGRSMTTLQRQSVDLSSSIPGWGSDLEMERRPGVPRDKAPDIGGESLYPDISQQVPRQTIHKSTEHARLTPVFGTSSPPKGLSGAIRDFAYRFSEGRLARWIALMAADRVDVAEDLLGDLAALRLPNIPKEMGLGAELKYNGPAFARKAALMSIGISALVVYMRARADDRRRR